MQLGITIDKLNDRKNMAPTRAVCLRHLTITSANIIRRHELNGLCAVSEHNPVDGSITSQRPA